MTFADLDNVVTIHGPQLTRLTDEEFFDLCQHNPTLRLERNADHEIIFMPPAGTESSRKSSEVVFQLMLWNRRHQLGYVFESSAGFTLPDGSVCSPDASWVAKAAYEALPEAQRLRFPPMCPAFVVEVRSPSDGLAPLRRKMETYLANGVKSASCSTPAPKPPPSTAPARNPKKSAASSSRSAPSPPCPASRWICGRCAAWRNPLKKQGAEPTGPAPCHPLAYPVPGRRSYRYFGR
ncbi:Uma2 family endonuclease [Hymenobacter baengnokdamensis]|uniref:Uma2 family endonuclease n=1 Tax=Hymenobacter baengnokdamensis TaxID=2615203 RepID=UPI001784CE8C|nr:Uma2 family endonuclease [Hymenobacter baengnokdamensis]